MTTKGDEMDENAMDDDVLEPFEDEHAERKHREAE